MRLIVDLLHPAHVNFFKQLLHRLHREGHDVRLLVLGRGKVPRIVEQELPEFRARRVGRYSRSRLGLYVRTGILREFGLFREVMRFRPDASLGVAAFQTGALSRLCRFRSVGVCDDPEYRLLFKLCKLFLHRLVVPECLGESARNIVSFRGLKEWAYLSPAYFCPNEAALAPYGLKPRSYIFIRDIDTASLNYRGQVVNNIEHLYDGGLCQARVVLSLENKRLKERYPRWRVLEEPVADIHSLMYYSSLVISSGDSMAREGAQLGVQAVYCGQRLMKANAPLVSLGFLHHITDPEMIIKQVRNGQFDVSAEEQRARRERLMSEWDDPVAVVHRVLTEVTERTRA